MNHLVRSLYRIPLPVKIRKSRGYCSHDVVQKNELPSSFPYGKLLSSILLAHGGIGGIIGGFTMGDILREEIKDTHNMKDLVFYSGRTMISGVTIIAIWPIFLRAYWLRAKRVYAASRPSN